MSAMQVNVKELNSIISKELTDRIFFFYGRDEHTKSYFENYLKKKICGDDTLGYVKFGENFTFEAFEDEILSIPMFGGNKFILVKNSGIFKNNSVQKNEKSDLFEEIIDSVPDGVTVCFSETEADNQNKLFHVLLTSSISYDASVMSEEELIKFAVNYAGKNGIKFMQDAASLLVEGINEDTLLLSNEIEKLCLAQENGIIDRKLVMECCSLSLQAGIFDLTDSICKNDKTEAMRVCNALLSSGESMQKVLLMVGSHFSKLYYVKEMFLSGKNTNEISDKLGNKMFYVSKLLGQCKNISLEKLKENVDFCFKADCDIKSGEISDKDALDLLIMSC